MESENGESNLNLVTAVDGLSPSISKVAHSPNEVILTVPVSSQVIINLQSVHSPLPVPVPLPAPASSPVSRISLHRSSCTGLVCRICHEDESQEELISPCECSGSLALVHAFCIQKWLSSSNTTFCEICKYQYVLNRKPKSLLQWLHNTSSHNGPSGFYGDVVCLVLLTPLCIVSVYLCAIGAKVYINHGLWEGTGLAMLCCFLMGVYILWCFVTVRFHCKRLRRWQASNQTVELVHKFRPPPAALKPLSALSSPISAIFSSPPPPTPGSRTMYRLETGTRTPCSMHNNLVTS